ncbi:MAG: DUF1778 domain-containing protein [Sulfurimonas sp.]|nr:DUF1778 domain-containing protein [Sulfurimonas sp.]
MTATSPRITARVSLDTQELLSKAAALIGISSINSFVLNAAIEKANMIVENENSIKLTQKDAILFINALEAPPQGNENLGKAFKKYNDKTL